MEIAILNESFLTENHIKSLMKLGKVTIFKNTKNEEEAINRLTNIDIAIVDPYLCPLNDKIFSSTKNLKLIVINSTGFEKIDIESANNNNIKIANVQGFSTDAVAEHVFALMFAVAKKIIFSDKEMRRKPFEINPENIEEYKFQGFNLKNKTFGIIGLGAIGERVAQIGSAFGMNIQAFNRTLKKIVNVKNVEFNELLLTSDYISINLALNKETEYIIGSKEIDLMKPNCIIINTARGKHIQGDALFDALVNHKILGAGLDMIDPNYNNPKLLELDNIVLSPHSAWFTKEALEKLADIIVLNIESYINGSPINIIN